MTDLGNKEIMARNIRFFMEKFDISRNALCEQIGVSYMTVSDWLNAKKYPRIDKIEKMAQLFHVPKSSLVEGPQKKQEAFKVPVLGSVPAGIPISAIQEILDWEEISEDMARRGEYFALRIRGTSMEPRFREGDVIIVRQQETVENGEIAVVMVNGDDATVKTFYRSEAGITLMGTNPAFPPLTFTPEQAETLPVRVIGKVVELRAKF